MSGLAIPRKDWADRRPTIPQDSVPKTELAAHHEGEVDNQPKSFWTPARRVEHMRGLERFHMDVRGWSAIGYSWVMFPTGHLYTGRGFNGLTAAQDSENSGTWACLFVGDFREREPTREARLKFQKLIERLEEFSDGRLNELGGHREFPNQGTECPGDGLIAVVKRNRTKYGLRMPRN